MIGPTASDGFEAFEQQRQRVEAAARSVVAACRADQFGRGWRPKGIDEVAIILESLGYSPQVVAELWYPSLFDFAVDVASAIDQFVSDEERAQSREVGWFINACRDYAIGALYSGPWIIAVVGLAVFGAALWSSLSTPLHLATAIALGVYGALVVAGVFAQAIARRLTFYFLQDNAALMLWTLDRFIVIAVVTTTLLGIVFWLALRSFYGDTDAALAAFFFTGSGIFQTSLAPLYTLRKFWWIAAVAAFAVGTTGTTFVLAFHRIVDVPWEPMVLAAEILVIGLAIMIVTLVWMRHRARRTGGERDAVPPAPRAILRAALPYGAFGACYFLAIVLDHLGAGLADGPPFHYRAGYELGCDVALLAIVPVVGVINVVLEDLPRRILRGAGQGIGESAPFDRAMLQFYLGAALAVLVASALTVGLAEVLGIWLLQHTILGLRGAAGDEAQFVLRYAAIAYGMLMLALLNCQLLFFLSRPRLAVIGASCGAAASAIGSAIAVLAHAGAASCVFALALGVAVFVAITTAETLGVMYRFTYSYYAAY